jgi:hypothetical protein
MRGDKQKTTVLGVVERKGRVIARTAEDVTAKTLQGFVKEFVLPKSTVFPMSLHRTTTLIGSMEWNTSTAGSTMRRRCMSLAIFTPTQLKDFGV